MRTSRLDEGRGVAFVITDVAPALHDAVLALAFRPRNDGFVQIYPSNHPQIDRIYTNFARHAEALVIQKARQRPIPWQDALRLFCEAPKNESIDWWLTGSAALAVRGLPVRPGDLDIIVSRADAPRLEALMLDHLIEPPRPGFIWETFTRSFPEACLEWCAGVDDRADLPLVGDVGPTAARRLETIAWNGHPIRIPPLDLQLMVNVRRGYDDRVRLIRDALAAVDAHPG